MTTLKARPVARGDPIRAQAWNNLAQRLTVLEQRTLRLQGAFPVAPSLVPYRYKSSDGDVVIARRVDFTTTPNGVESTEDTYLAKPYTMRPSVLVRGGHTYVYTTDFERVDTLAGNPETQVLTPAYEVDDLVWAILTVQFTGVEYDPLPAQTNLAPVSWLMDNNDGRAWAQKFGA